MSKYNSVALAAAGACAGIVAGLFGAGGGLVLVPLLTLLVRMDDRDVFPSSIAIILPICLVSLTATVLVHGVDWLLALPYMIGSGIGGLLAGKWGNRIPALWLHRGLGLLILWGGIRNLC